MPEKMGFVSGHDFSRAAQSGLMRALAPEVRFLTKGTDLEVPEKIGFVSGHDFSRAAKSGLMRGLAPEVRFEVGHGFSRAAEFSRECGL